MSRRNSLWIAPLVFLGLVGLLVIGRGIRQDKIKNDTVSKTIFADSTQNNSKKTCSNVVIGQHDTATSEDIKKWKTYVDTERGFSFMYPDALSPFLYDDIYPPHPESDGLVFFLPGIPKDNPDTPYIDKTPPPRLTLSTRPLEGDDIVFGEGGERLCFDTKTNQFYGYEGPFDSNIECGPETATPLPEDRYVRPLDSDWFAVFVPGLFFDESTQGVRIVIPNKNLLVSINYVYASDGSCEFVPRLNWRDTGDILSTFKVLP